MAAAADLRAIALALPETYEDTHRRKPAFRVNKRIFAMLGVEAPGASREGFFAHLSGARPVVGLKLDRDDQLNMIEAFPEAVGQTATFGHHGWTYVWLDVIDPDGLALLVGLAWTSVAPKQLSKSMGKPGP
jgi:hypothetical protein